MSDKHMRRHTASVVAREVETKTIGSHFTPANMAIAILKVK